MYNVNAGIPKTLLLRVLSWAGAYYLGETGKQASQAVAEATISPELVPAEGATGGIQSTESHLGPYLLHDFFLWHLICLRKTPAQVFDVALQVFEKIFRRIRSSIGCAVSCGVSLLHNSSVLPAQTVLRWLKSHSHPGTVG